MKWKISSAKICGKHNNVTQDFICQTPLDDFACVVGSDGAGVASHAREGADFTTQTMREILMRHKEGIFEYSDQKIKEELIMPLYESITEMAVRNELSVDDYMCTLMFFVSNGDQFLIGNIGDGMLGVMDDAGRASVISNQERGRFVNQSYFVTQNDCYEHLRISRGRFNCRNVYFMMTDGSVDCLYNVTTGHFANALKIFCGWTRQYEPHKVSTYITNSMIKLFPSKTDDDCAIALICGFEE